MSRLPTLFLFLWATWLVALLPFANAELDPILIKGSHFFYKTNGTAFFIRGLTYYIPTLGSTGSTQFSDALADGSTCERDIPLFKSLGINAVQILYVNPALDHSACMNALADAGIYVFATLGTPGNSVGLSSLVRWDEDMLNQYTAVVDSLANFTNTLAFSIGALWLPVEETLVYVKAAIRDVKQHMRERGHRDIPLGWISLDGSTDTESTYEYLTCGEDRPDFLAMSVPDTCEDVSYADDMTKQFSDSNIPVFGVATGCSLIDKSNDTRSYEYLTKFYPDGVAPGLSGAFVMDYVDFQGSQAKPYGLVDINVTNFQDNVAPRNGYYALSSVIANLEPNFSEFSAYTPTTTTPACPTSTYSQISTAMPAKPHPPLCACMVETLQCVAKENWNPPDKESSTYGFLGTLPGTDGESAQKWLDSVTGACDDDPTQNCPGLTLDAQNGTYGAFIGCNETASYSWAANEYWQRHGSCDLNGTTELRDEPPPPSSDCKFLLDQVGDNGEKTITAFLESVPTPTAGTSGPGSNEDNVSNEAEKHGLKGGAKGGIAVGVLASVALACLAALYLLRRKKQSKKDASVSEQNDRDLPKDAMSPYVEEKHQTEIFELPDNQGVPGVFEKRRFSELPNGQHVSELAESKEVSELPVDRHVSELQ